MNLRGGFVGTRQKLKENRGGYGQMNLSKTTKIKRACIDHSMTFENEGEDIVLTQHLHVLNRELISFDKDIAFFSLTKDYLKK